MFYTVGFAFAYGESANPNAFIGNAAFAASNWKTTFTGVGFGRWTDWCECAILCDCVTPPPEMY